MLRDLSDCWVHPFHPYTLTVINDLAILLNDQGNVNEAEILYRRALETREQTLGLEHPDTLTSVNDLGTFLMKQGKLAEAEPLLQRAVEGRKRTLGANHPHTLNSIANLAHLHKAKEGPNEASSSSSDLQQKQGVKKNKKKGVDIPAAPPSQEAIDAAERIANELLAELDLEEKEKGKKGAKGKGGTGQQKKKK